MWFLFWLVLIGVVIVAELIALHSDGLPLTGAYLRLTCAAPLRVVLFAFFFWMAWHWMIQPWLLADTNGVWPADVLFVALGGIVGLRIGPPKRGVDCGDGDEV